MQNLWRKFMSTYLRAQGTGCTETMILRPQLNVALTTALVVLYVLFRFVFTTAVAIKAGISSFSKDTNFLRQSSRLFEKDKNF